MTNVGVLERDSVDASHVTDTEKYTGLCTTCRHRTDCVFARAEIQPVVSCEEFEEEEKSRVRDVRSLRVQAGGTPDIDPSLKGLCMNCANRHDCKHEKPEGGVWHCEDYE